MKPKNDIVRITRCREMAERWVSPNSLVSTPEARLTIYTHGDCGDCEDCVLYTQNRFAVVLISSTECLGVHNLYLYF